MRKKYIAFDIGGTRVKHSLLFEDGTFIEKNQYNTSTTDLQQLLADMVRTIEQYKSSHRVCGIGISMPGFINIETGHAETAGSVTALEDKNLKTLLEQKVNLPVEVENDGNCVALAEMLNGNARDSQNFICITIGTGIGGGIVLNGSILHGHSFRGGEFGFMVTQKGANGREIWHHNGSTSSLVEEYKKLKGINPDSTIAGEVIFEEAAKDNRVNSLIDEWLSYVGCGIYNLAVTLNPEKILIGGGVSAQEDLLNLMRTQFEKLEFWENFRLPILRCKHKNDAGMLGALMHFLSRTENK
ncbi:ROK family protein [Radiobacillus kanasensis]|uniref:ROK family protein n=1 Tax=Radiobacillus kanasensis TaxID=2844358 RepID=UPI001E34585D|nr:ROK family protein [Radiobacillus kanasensis]UFU00625.1 ROK family protein [Radiobacillus kanasensis]